MLNLLKSLLIFFSLVTTAIAQPAFDSIDSIKLNGLELTKGVSIQQLDGALKTKSKELTPAHFSEYSQTYYLNLHYPKSNLQITWEFDPSSESAQSWQRIFAKPLTESTRARYIGSTVIYIADMSTFNEALTINTLKINSAFTLKDFKQHFPNTSQHLNDPSMTQSTNACYVLVADDFIENTLNEDVPDNACKEMMGDSACYANVLFLFKGNSLTSMTISLGTGC